jgi:hypothetical protein
MTKHLFARRQLYFTINVTAADNSTSFQLILYWKNELQKAYKHKARFIDGKCVLIDWPPGILPSLGIITLNQLVFFFQKRIAIPIASTKKHMLCSKIFLCAISQKQYNLLTLKKS